MIYTELTKKAMRICFEAHRDQQDKGGVPYVFHPFHLAEQMDTEEAVCAALLHDVVEDTGWTLDELAAEGFPYAVLRALDLLTHDDGTPYLDYVRRLKDDPVAAAVKLADLRHNSTPGRLSVMRQEDFRRIRKYLKAQAILTGGEADLENMCLRLELPADEEAPAGGRPAAGGRILLLEPDGTPRV